MLKPDEWQARLSNGAATFIAIVNEADVGLVTGAKWRGREGVAGLFGMWVAPEVRRRGIGEKLAHAVIIWARSSGFKRLALEVGNENLPAIGSYSRLGFKRTGSTGSLPPPRDYIFEHARALEL